MTGESLGVTGRRDVKKIAINNALRGQLRGVIVCFSLSHKNPAVRLKAVQEIVKDMDAETATLLRTALRSEQDGDVQEAMRTGIAMVDVSSADKATRLQAIEALGTSLLPEARQRLQALLEGTGDGRYAEPEAALREAAVQGIAKFDQRRQFYTFLETAFFGLSLGSVLLLAAIGLAITFCLMGVINMAHGELIMLGAYTTYVVQLLMPNHIAFLLLVAEQAAFVVLVLVCFVFFCCVFWFLFGCFL